MFQKLVSHNRDIQRLVEKGYAIGFDSNYLIIRDIPYLDAEGKLQIGAIVTTLVFTDQLHVSQQDHQVFFAGAHPHNIDGSKITNLGGGETTLALSSAARDVRVQRQFSNKPFKNGVWSTFQDFFEKVESYVRVISGPAIERHAVTPLTFRVVEPGLEEPVFKIRDTLTSRAEISELSAKFKDDVIAIIGLGGTGAYVLDLMVKTPVKEVRGFDGDDYHVHNAFRSPGSLLPEQEFGRRKSDVYQERYESFRHGLLLKPEVVTAESIDDLRGVTFAFVCVDKGSSRKAIFDVLIALKIPFIDVGMGPKRRNGSLSGMLRVTYYSAEKAMKVMAKELSELSDPQDNIYRTNIQIGELNALNAALAVVKYKKVRGFYTDEKPAYHFLFEIADMKIASLDEADDED
ncbi:ThiF family adenylyltransferase [Rhizobium rhizogenes]|uniref:ThiF family adenylyltransferase n=1 Tax=Rhizobium rhizogenes TaxID=359 RepID=UPI00193D2543|nr:ThiF family adenylyltransferase [Rhizobium rhizogenes]QRM38748.1 ThiF family adenylyltransferase [Rhizobium rhizogenes]